METEFCVRPRNFLFILYKTGVPDKYQNEARLGPYYKESKLLGAYLENGEVVKSGIEIPDNNFEYPNMFHCWLLFPPLPESKVAISQMIELIKE